MPDTIERLRHLIAENLDLGLTVEQVDPGAALLEDGLKLDSLAIVELISLIEETFGIELGEDDLNMDAFRSTSSLAAVIDRRVRAAAEAA